MNKLIRVNEALTLLLDLCC